MPDALTPIEVFCVYAHEDESHLQKLKAHLSGLRRQGLISIWHDRQIIPGTDWAQAIDTYLEAASLILLLVSADFLSSDYCYEIEMHRAMERHEMSVACVIPILVRPCDWMEAPFSRLQCLPYDGKPVTIWDNLDQAWNDVTGGIRRAIMDLPLLSTSASRATLPIVWNVPYPRNPFFIGREDLLLRLRTQLQAGQITVHSQPQAISGLGGIGKTQIAVEYAYRYHQEYEVVLWAGAENQETLIFSYNTIARLLKLPEREASEQEVVIQAVKRWLQTHRKWLLILDNADDLALIASFLPPVQSGHLLLTTRAQAMGRLARRIEVETLPDEQGALFLLRRAALIEPFVFLDDVSIEDCQWAMRITQELGGLPLALDQAGAYLEETGESLAKYHHIYQHRRTTLLEDRGGLVSDHPEPVATTWSLSFQRVEEKNPAAADLLRLCAYLAPDVIPENILTQGASHLGLQLAPVAADPFLLSQAIEALRAYSLIHRDARAQTVSVHRLMQVVLRDSMAREAEKQWKHRVVRAVNASSPNVEDVTQWDACERWLPHVQVCANWIEQEDMTFPEAACLLNQAGYYLDDRARYGEAEPLYRGALAIREETLGRYHPDTAASLNNLAALYESQGKYDEAEPLYWRALKINEQQLGTEHPDTATSLNNLAGLYGNQGKYGEAEPLYLRALEICEQQLGTEHPDTAASLNDLAGLYYNQGKYSEAEPLYLRALEICEQQLGAAHPSTAQSVNNLAMLYATQGKYGEAEPLFRQALEINEQQLGTEHPSTAQSLNNLAMLYKTQGKYDEAEPLFRQALEINEQQLGTEHPSTAQSLNNLATLYESQGRYSEAEPLYQRALKINEQQLGAKHPDTASSLNNLATLYDIQGEYGEAEPLYQRALEINEQQLGTEHPSTAQSLNNLAGLYGNQGKYGEAEPLYQRALEINERQLGTEHPSTAQSLNNLAGLYYNQGKYGEAEPLYRRALEINERQLGTEHPSTAQSLNNLALLYQEQGKYVEAESLLRQALSIYEQQLGNEHPHAESTRKNYASLLHTLEVDGIQP